MGTPSAFTVFEAAAGSGRLCADVLGYLRAHEPELYDLVRYVQQDPSLRGDDGRRRLLAAGVPEEKIEVAASPPDSGAIEGCIISNELLDALPFERVRMRDGRLYELRVGLDAGRLVDVETEPSATIQEYFAALGLQGPGEGCEAEVCLGAAPWITQAATALSRGYVLTLDYGYEAADLYAPWRRRGTLLTFYRHTSGDDPYAHIGLQDITASVDFTTVRRAAEAAGLKTVVQASQAEYLAALGIGDVLSEPPSPSAVEAYYALRRAAIELTDMAGLGRIQVMLQSKGL
jgi:SAM-dependent MidA family methyltransferase